MSKTHHFRKRKDLELETAFGRDHFWHYHPQISKGAESYMVKVVMPKGGGHNFHRHPKMHEILYILKGRAEQWVEAEVHVLEAGDSVYIDADMVHATFNGGEGELEFLAILSPPQGWEAGTVDMFEELPYSEYRIENKIKL